jgi:hypothetical protein
MQLLLNEVDKWSKTYGFVINPIKTQVIFIEKRSNKKELNEFNNTNFPKLMLGNVKL